MRNWHKNNRIKKVNKKEWSICMHIAIHQQSQGVRHNIPEKKNISLRPTPERGTVTPP